MRPPADTLPWALPRRPSRRSSPWDTPVSRRLRPASPPTCRRRHTSRRSLPCPHPLSSKMCRGLHSYLRPYTSNTSSSSSFSKRSTAGSSRTPGRTSGCRRRRGGGIPYPYTIISLSHCRRTQERLPLNPHRLRSGYEFSHPLHVPQQMTQQQQRYLAEGTDW